MSQSDFFLKGKRMVVEIIDEDQEQQPTQSQIKTHNTIPDFNDDYIGTLIYVSSEDSLYAGTRNGWQKISLNTHQHNETDIRDLDKFGKKEIHKIITAKADKNHKHSYLDITGCPRQTMTIITDMGFDSVSHSVYAVIRTITIENNMIKTIGHPEKKQIFNL